MQLALATSATPDERWELAKQIGVTHAVVHTSMTGTGMDTRHGHLPVDFDSLLQIKNDFENAGLEVAVIEGGAPLSDAIRLGKDGCDEEIDSFCEFVRNVGAVGIPVICYSWMVGLWWLRTATRIPTRGGSLTTGYDHRQMELGPQLTHVTATEEDLWDNLEYFLERVVPVAEEAGVKLALHPDDPPLPTIRGIPRIIRSVDAFDRVIDCFPSESNGIVFCQGNFVAMNADIPETIRYFGDNIHFAHFRDIEGTAESFTETWHDEGPTNMLEAMRAYHEIGFSGPIRPDHVPTMSGETNNRPGYEMKGRLFAVGYMKGLLEQIET